MLNLFFPIVISICISTSAAQQCTFQDLQRALIPYDSCLSNIMDLLFHRRDNQQANLQVFLQRVCNSVAQTSLRSCHDALDQTLNFCTSINQRGLLDVLKASAWSGVGYICQNSARLLTEFREQGQGYECLKQADSAQHQCLRLSPILSMYISSYSVEFCHVNQSTGLRCLDQSFRAARCSEIASSFLNGYYQALTQATPCGAIGNKYNIIIVILALCMSLVSLRQ